MFENNKRILRAFANAFLEEFVESKVKVGEISEASSLVSYPWFFQLGCIQNPIHADSIHREREQRLLVDVLFLMNGTERSIIIPSDDTKRLIQQGNTNDTDVFCLLLCPEFKMEGQHCYYHHLLDEKRGNDYHFFWINFEQYPFGTTLKDYEEWGYLLWHCHKPGFVADRLKSNQTKDAYRLLQRENWSEEQYQYYQQAGHRIAKRKEENRQTLGREQTRTSESANKNIKLSLSRLEMSLSMYPYRVPEKRDIRINLANIDSLTFNLFRHWSQHYQERLGKPLIIKDEQNLIENAKDALAETIIALFLEETFVFSDFNLSWGVGYVMELTYARLVQRWNVEYILKEGFEFKAVQALKAVDHFFADHEVARLEVEHLYQSFMDQLANYEGVEKEVKLDKPLTFVPQEEKPPSVNTGEVKKVIDYLLNQRLVAFQETTKSLTVDPECSYDLFHRDEIVELINDNRRLFSVADVTS